jgi:hypothetical protein
MIFVFVFPLSFSFFPFFPFRSLGGEGLNMVMPPMLTQLELNHSAVCDASIEAVAAKVEMKEILPSQSGLTCGRRILNTQQH